MKFAIFFAFSIFAEFSLAASASKEGPNSVVVKIGGPEEEYIGQLDRKAVRNVIGGLKSKFHECHSSGGSPELGGQVVVSFDISSDGKVDRYSAKNSTMNNSKVEDCVMGLIANAQFPTLPSGMVEKVLFPIAFDIH